MAAIAMRATMTKRMASKGTISQGAQTFGVTNFAWASRYVLSIPLGGALIDPGTTLPSTPQGSLPHDVALGAACSL
jgi:hypothetical protein